MCKITSISLLRASEMTSNKITTLLRGNFTVYNVNLHQIQVIFLNKCIFYYTPKEQDDFFFKSAFEFIFMIWSSDWTPKRISYELLRTLAFKGL